MLIDHRDSCAEKRKREAPDWWGRLSFVVKDIVTLSQRAWHRVTWTNE